MAGIGFELKKLFRGKSIISKVRAYGYTGMITTGPMLLGILFLLLLTLVGRRFGLARREGDVLVTMITYSLVFSLLASGVFSMIDTRYLADMLYELKNKEILSSLYGTLCLLLPLGGIPYGIFLLFSGIGRMQMLLDFVLYMTLLVAWTEMNYLTAIKDYRGILKGYGLAILTAVLLAFILSRCFGASLEGLLVSCAAGYGVMALWDLGLLYQFFPDEGRRPFYFLRWFDKNKELAWTGVLVDAGLYAHLFIAWHSRIGVQMRGLFYAAPDIDVPAMFAFLTVLITTVNFVASTEVHFYPVYRKYYDLFNGTGSIDEIDRAEKQMLDVLESELAYTARIQFSVTLFMISIGPMILGVLPLGFTNLMSGYFRILCVGYGAFAVGNVIMMILMYFADDVGAFRASAVFFISTTAGSLLSLLFPARYYGFAFAFGSILYLLYCRRRLAMYTRHLGYYVLSTQPIVAEDVRGVFTEMEEKLDGEMEKRES